MAPSKKVERVMAHVEEMTREETKELLSELLSIMTSQDILDTINENTDEATRDFLASNLNMEEE